MAARTVPDHSGGKLTRSKARLMSTPYEASPTCNASQHMTQPAFLGKENLLYEVPEPYAASSPLRKRKKTSDPLPSPHHKVSFVDLTGDDKEANLGSATTPKKRKIKARANGSHEEKRLKMFRKKAPLSYLEKLERATGQR